MIIFFLPRYMDVYLLQLHLLKRLSFLYWISFLFLSKINWLYLCGCISGLSIIFHWCQYLIFLVNTTITDTIISSGGDLVAKSHLTLVTPWTVCSPPGSSVHGIFQARIQEWIAISFSRESSWPRDQTQVSCFGGHLLHCKWNLY